VVRRWASLNVPNPVPLIDGLIAATALTHGLTVATRNVRDFRASGVQVVNPFTGAAPG
jgi:predicted nucleic acid-binding protein